MQRRSTDIRLSTPGAYVRQRPALTMAVEENRDMKVIPDSLCELMRHLTAFGQRRAVQRHDRHDVGRPDSRMDSRMISKVDLIDRTRDSPQKSIDKLGPKPCKRDHDTVVIRVGIRVENMGSTSSRRDRGNHLATPPFRKIRHRLEEAFHRSVRVSG